MKDREKAKRDIDVALTHRAYAAGKVCEYLTNLLAHCVYVGLPAVKPSRAVTETFASPHNRDQAMI